MITLSTQVRDIIFLRSQKRGGATIRGNTARASDIVSTVVDK